MTKKTNRIGIFLIILLSLAWPTTTHGQNSYSKDSIQARFLAGKIVSVSGNIACYRLNGLHETGVYGYCLFDETYSPRFTKSVTAYNTSDIPDSIFYNVTPAVATFKPNGKDGAEGNSNFILNNKCYTIIAPLFDYALPFSEGWGAVCIDKKWSYVSVEGDFLCDLVLDAAYPFKDGHAKVIYKGVPYVIDTLGAGLPPDISTQTSTISKTLRASTIKQLSDEKQFEKIIEKGVELYNSVFNNTTLCNVPSNELEAAILSQSYAIEAQSTLMTYCINDKGLYEYYQGLHIKSRLAPLAEHPEMYHFIGTKLLSILLEEHPNDTVIEHIVNFVEERDYKSALICFENWNSQITKPIELAFYYCLAELSDDFETANSVLPYIASWYENDSFIWIEDTLIKGFLLATILNSETAKDHLTQAIKQAKNQGDKISETIGNFVLALLYKNIGASNECAFYFGKAIEIINNDNGQSIPTALKNEILYEYLDFLICEERLSDNSYELMYEYVQSEIAFNISLFLSEDASSANRYWSHGIVRIRKFLRHLPYCKDSYYCKSAYKLVLFQNSFYTEIESWFQKGISNTDNPETKNLIKEYFALKQSFKGFDIYDLEKEDQENYETASKINDLEKRIKALLIKDDATIRELKNIFLDPFGNANADDIIICLFEYDSKIGVKEYGLLVSIGNMSTIQYIPLGKKDSFDAKTLWDCLLDVVDIKEHNHCYFDLGKFDYFAVEFEPIGGDMACFKYELHRVVSLIHVNRSSKTEYDNRIALFGGLDYGVELVAQHRGVVDNGYLEYSKIEIDSITKIMQSTMHVIPFTQQNGTTDSFFQFSHDSPEIIHLSTHGYQHNLNEIEYIDFKHFLYRDRFNYYRQNTDIEDVQLLMNKTGLFLSLNENDTTNVLLSREVASCDLGNTRLVVLSACSTVLGVSSDSQTSTIGLTTAFAMAKAQNIITSLRDVNDQKSCEYMVIFYKQLKQTNDINISFKNTVKEMRSRYPNQKEYWGSFVLLENH